MRLLYYINSDYSAAGAHQESKEPSDMVPIYVRVSDTDNHFQIFDIQFRQPLGTKFDLNSPY